MNTRLDKIGVKFSATLNMHCKSFSVSSLRMFSKSIKKVILRTVVEISVQIFHYGLVDFFFPFAIHTFIKGP